MSFKEHTVKSYDDDLKSLAAIIEEMMKLVIQSIDMISIMLKSPDKAILEGIKKHDYKINILDLEVEKKVTSILALRQPMAVDLRYIIAALKVSTNLERVGDQAKNIIKKISDIGDKEFKVDVEDSLQKMIEICQNMVKNSVIAFNTQNAGMADDVLKRDDEVDDIYQNLFKFADNKNFTKDQVKKIATTILIAKSFERLADHSTNIAEITHLVITGKVQ